MVSNDFPSSRVVLILYSLQAKLVAVQCHSGNSNATQSTLRAAFPCCHYVSRDAFLRIDAYMSGLMNDDPVNAPYMRAIPSAQVCVPRARPSAFPSTPLCTSRFIPSLYTPSFLLTAGPSFKKSSISHSRENSALHFPST